MNRFCANFLSLFIWNKHKRHEFRKGLLPPNLGDLHGTGNVVRGKPPECHVVIWGNNNCVEFLEPRDNFGGLIRVGFADCPVNNCHVVIGPRTHAVNVTMWLMEDGSSIRIGADCLISYHVQFWCSDTHALLDDKGAVVNAGAHKIEIGDHCWIGYGVHVLKDVVLPPGSIVGLGAVVANKSFSQHNCAYAGNPARVVRENVHWDKCRPKLLAGSVANGNGSAGGFSA